MVNIPTKRKEIFSRKTDKPNQYIPGCSTGEMREAVIIWDGWERPISAWAANNNITVNCQRERVRKLGVCAESMAPNKNQGNKATGAIKTNQEKFEARCKKIMELLDDKPNGMNTSELHKILKIRISGINSYLRRMEAKGLVRPESIGGKLIWFSTARPVDKAYKRICFMGHEEIEVEPIEFTPPEVQSWVYVTPVESLIPINNQ